MKNKVFFYSLWTILLLVAPVTLLQGVLLSDYFKFPIITVNFFQRLLGMWAFTMLFVQVVLGAFMVKLTEKLGGFVFNFHIFQGILIYILILAHPALFVAFNYLSGSGIDPFYVFTQVCVYCKNKTEYALSFGRVSFWLITIAVVAGRLRTASLFLRVHWRKFHILNYLAFFFVAIHSRGVGSDIGVFPFSVFYLLSVAVVAGITILKIRNYIMSLKTNS